MADEGYKHPCQPRASVGSLDAQLAFRAALTSAFARAQEIVEVPPLELWRYFREVPKLQGQSRSRTSSTAAGRASAASPIAGHPQVTEAIALLAERFADTGHDGPHAYEAFLADPDDDEARARLRNEAVAAIDQYLAGFHAQT